MKSTIFLLVFFPALLFGQSLFLSEAITVSTSGTSYRSPRIALLDDNRPVVYWGKSGTNPKLYLAFWENNAFGNPIEVNTNGVDFDIWGGGLGPHIAAGGNTVYLVFEKYGQGIYCIKSEDGGQSFNSPVSVYIMPPGRVATLPTIAIDADLNPIISFVTTNFSEEDARYEITHSTDGGLTFPPTTVANTSAAGDEVCECCPSSIGVAGDEELYLAFRNNNNNLRDIWIAKSTDNGASFEEALDIDHTDWSVFSCPQSGPDIFIGTDSIYSAYYSGANGSDVYFSSVHKATMELGSHFQIPSISGQSVSQNFPSIAGSGDTLGVIWQEIGDNGLEIVMTWSVNGSANLATNHLMVDNGTTSQKLPDMVFKDGIFHIVYEDNSTGTVLYRMASFEEMTGTNFSLTEEFSISLQPNPVSMLTSIYFDPPTAKSYKAELFATTGQIINSFQGNDNRIEMDLEHLAKGIYFLNIQTRGQLITKRLIKL